MKRITLPLFAFLICFYSSAQDPTFNITTQSQWNPPSVLQYNDIWGYVDCQENEYAIIGSNYEVHFINITDPTAPAEVASYAGGESSDWRDIKTYRGRAYAVSDNTSEGLMIFNLTNLPLSVEHTYQSNNDFNRAQNIFIDQNFGRLYVVGSDTDDLLIFDLTANPDDPVLLSATSLQGGYIRDIYVRNNLAYCSHLANGLYIYDCSDALNIYVAGSIDNYPGDILNSSSWLSEDGTQLIFCDESPGAKVKLMDVSDPSNLSVSTDHLFSSTLLGADMNSLANKPYIRDDFVFVSYFHDGVQVFDISNPDSIQKVAYLDTYPDNTNYDGIQGNWGIYPFFPSGNIIASDIYNGLFVMSMDLIELEPLENANEVDAQIDLSSAPIICEGDSVMLNAIEGDFTYLWMKDGQVLDNEEYQMTAKETGAYQLEISNGACTAMSDIIEIDFIAPPDLSNLQGDVADICYGENYPILAPAGLDYYIWLKDGNALPNTNNLLMVVQSGTYNLIAYNNGCATTSEFYEINVIDIPTPNITAVETTICSNQEALIEAAEGAENYSWYYNNLMVAETSENFFTVNQSGNYHVVLHIGTCTEVSDYVEISVIQAPNNTIGINGPTTFCANVTVTLSAAQSPEIIEWAWSLNNNVIGTEPNIEVSGAGHYELVVTSSNSCTATNSIDLEVLDIVNPEITIDGSMLLSTVAESYQWYFNETLIQGATEQTFQPQSNGMYQVEITAANGCTAISDPYEYQATGVSIPESLSDLVVYPNPADNFIRVDLSSLSASPLIIQLINTNGQLLQSLEVSAATLVSEKVDMKSYPAGVYFLKLTNEEGSVSQKIVKN